MIFTRPGNRDHKESETISILFQNLIFKLDLSNQDTTRCDQNLIIPYYPIQKQTELAYKLSRSIQPCVNIVLSFLIN